MKYQRRIFIFAAVLIAALCYMSASQKNVDASSRRKAKYYYSSGMVADAEGKSAEAYEFYRRAHLADPSYPEAAMALGTSSLSLDNGELQTPDFQDDALDLMRPYVKKYPEDLYEALYYAYVADNLGLDDEAVEVLEQTYALHPDYSMALVQLSDLHLRKQNLPAAIEALNRYEKQEGISQQVTMVKMSYMLANHDTLGAEKEIARLMAHSPTDPEPLILKGSLCTLLQQPDSALIYYRLAEAMDPDSSSPKLALAQFYEQQGDSLAYDDMMYKVLIGEDLDMDTKIDLTAEYLQTLIHKSNDTRRGDNLFSQLQSQAPHNAKVLDLAARYSAAKQDFKGAVENISYAIDRDPTNTTYWSQLITYYAANDSLDQALDAYKRAREHVVPDENMMGYYASVAQLAKKYDLAADTYKEMIHAITPNAQIDSLQSLDDLPRTINLYQLDRLSDIYTMLGDVYNILGDFPKSYRAYDNALVYNNGNQLTKNNYAYFLSLNGGDLNRALALSEETVKAEPSNPTYLDTFAWINFLKGNIDTALEYQKKAVEKMEAEGHISPDVYYHLGEIENSLGNNEEALKYWEKSAEAYETRHETDEPEYPQILVKIKEMKKKL